MVAPLTDKNGKCCFVFLVLHVWYTGSDPLVRQVYEFDAHVEDLTLGVRPMSRALWKYRRQITVEHLGNSFQQEVLSGGEDQYKVLDAFLKQVPPNVQLISLCLTVISARRVLPESKHRFLCCCCLLGFGFNNIFKR